MSKDSDLTDKAREVLLARVASMLNTERPTHAAQASTNKFTDFASLPGYEEMRLHRTIGDKLNLADPYFRIHDGKLGPRSLMAGREVINFSTYDYLGLNGHPEVVAAAKAAIDQYGVSASASRHVAGGRPVHLALEEALAAHYESESAVVFVSGYATNVGVIGQLVGPRDLVVMDAAVHDSAQTGAVLSGATRRSFVHNDLDKLEQILKTSRKKFERTLIVVEGLYSMEGDFPDLPRLIEIKERFGAWLMVDEAHALGVLGPRGHGIFEHFGTDPGAVDIWMGTLSKTLAGCGGYIAGSEVLIDYIRRKVGSFVFSVAMPPVIAASVAKALELMHREPERVQRLQANGAHFHAYARQRGLDTGPSRGFAVAPVFIGDSLASVILSQELLERGINVSPAFYPGVPMKTARLRFFLTSEHQRQDLELAIDAVADAARAIPGRLAILSNLV